ncbi:uncharacterized protein LOC126248581 [Schistocerca nitens]|uniref:uncharacterized protein LOC126248581 n=1 Tax=Schistocerca nitens TaxID=7011 RepID=UPI0021183486|nr:uncharacterized protein LOC126248581 [Schistocerca nitens]
MPYRCCVPNCRGNYDGGPKVTVFKFPEDEATRKKWLSRIRRHNFTPSSSSRVCHVHFHKDDVIWETQIVDERTGQLLRAPLLKPRLRPHAVPSLLPNCPSYLSKEESRREGPEEKKQRLENEQLAAALQYSLASQKDYENTFSFSSLEELMLRTKEVDLPNEWSVIEKHSDFVCFLKIIRNPAPLITHSVVIDSNLNVSLFKKDVQIKTLGKRSFPVIVTNIHEIVSVLQEFSDTDCGHSETSIDSIVEIVKDSLGVLKDSLQESEKEMVDFIYEQVSLINVKKFNHRFSSTFMILCCLLFSISSHAYNFLRSSSLMKMPHPSTLRRVCSKFNVNPSHERLGGSNFLSYARQKFQYLNSNDVNVVLSVDEIHLNSYLEYKGGSVLGMSYNSECAANSAFVFMLQSVKSLYRDVVHILPVKTISSNALYNVLLAIINGLELIGYRVFCVVTDNNKINSKTMSMFSLDKAVNIVFKHPSDPNRPLFFLIDAVHIVKCIRNVWLNQKNDGKDMFYPQFPVRKEVEENKFSVASFKTLKQIYDIDSSSLVKYCHTLSLKSLCPTSLEKQSMKLVLQIFNRHVSEGLEVASDKFDLRHAPSTAEYIRIITKWFDVMNVKSVFKGKHKQNPYMDPLTTDSVSMQFLLDFLDWLDVWKAKGLSSGFLTKETFFAIQHTTYAVVEIARYCTEELGMSYLLTAKLQTDVLERRFGKYRQLAGSQYNVSVTQVYEAEKKLRIQSVMPLVLCSPSYGNITVGAIKNFMFSEVEETHTLDIEVSVTQDDVLSVKDIATSLTFIAGYCAHAVIKKLKCESCLNEIVIEKELPINEHFSLIQRLDHGGLKYPSDTILNMIVYTYIVISKLLKEHERDFLACTNQRAIACAVALATLHENDFLLFDGVCCNGHSSQAIMKSVVWVGVNIFLNNYCKKVNGKKNSKNTQRKLQTLTT